MWRLWEHRLFHRSHTIERLPVHLPKEPMLYFQAGFETNANHDRASELFLTGQWKCSRSQLTSHEIQKHCVWTNRQWNIRKNTKCFEWIYTVNPVDIGKYYFCVPLLHVKGQQLFHHLCTVDGIMYNSFQEAAKKFHLPITDTESEGCLHEAVTHKMPKQLRWFFAIVCIFCFPANVFELWTKFKDALSEDFHNQHTPLDAENFTLLELENIFKYDGRSYKQFKLPSPVSTVA